MKNEVIFWGAVFASIAAIYFALEVLITPKGLLAMFLGVLAYSGAKSSR